MVAKKTKRYLLVYDESGDPEVWIMHADLTVRLTTLHPVDIADSDIPILDLRSDKNQ